MYAGQVLRLTPGQPAETVVTVPQGPSGLGFLPDGRLLVVSMHDRRVLRLDAGGLAERADLSPVASWHANDMLVDSGRAGLRRQLRRRLRAASPGDAASLALIQPDGAVSVAAPGMLFANGMALTHAAARWLPKRAPTRPVYRVRRRRRRHAQRSPCGRRIGAELPDGICADAADLSGRLAFTGEVIRVAPNGDTCVPCRFPRTRAPGWAGPATLFICAAVTWVPDEALANRTGQILAQPVDVPACS